MVFGNMGNDSGTGVAFTRNPATGEKKLFGDYLTNAQGEDVVAGIRTPKHIDELKNDMPEIYAEFVGVAEKLERHYRDMQDLEFTIERGRLWMLQTRNGKRTGPAAVKIAVEMVREGLIDERTALLRVPAGDLDQLLHKMIDPKAKANVLTRGINASPGAAAGRVVFTPQEAESWAAKGERVILVRRETSPEDVKGMDAAQAILTSTGGPTCVSGETRILTDRGFMTAQEAHKATEAGESLLILSFDSEGRKAVWRPILWAGKRTRSAVKVAVSQSGRSQLDTMTITPDHKMFTVLNRKLAKKPLSDVLRDDEFICVVDRIPGFKESDGINQQLAYLMGALVTDGYIRVRRTKGEVVFTQKPTPEKQTFIEAVATAFEQATGHSFTSRHLKHSEGFLRGRRIAGDALDLSSTRRAPAEFLASIRDNLPQWVIGLTEEELLSFLAGAIDGDGTFNRTTASRINIFASKKYVIEAVVLACLRLGILPKMTRNRTICNIQIVEQSERLLSYTRRVKGNVNTPIYESKLFSARGLFADIVNSVNRGGKIRCRTERNLLVGEQKVRRTLDFCEPSVRKELEGLLNADLRMYRVCKLDDVGKIDVYNFEVEGSTDLDKNYIAFTSMLTPLLISNSHAAVVARGWGKPCVVGAGEININYGKNEFSVNGTRIRQGDWITVDGTSGQVIAGQAPLIDPELGEEFHQLMQWADSSRRLRVRTNADTPDDAKVARGFGAEGIGLCRTEHMFFEGDRIDYVRQMILGSLEYKQLERELSTVESELKRTTAPKKREEMGRARRRLKKEIEEPKRLYKGGL
ncbi:MAG TPA: PEP-utilizing enzyme, partial [Blastocatellia bacterium]|nr:PEP-utilizing enzyme [Blastocatellia bacterium]